MEPARFSRDAGAAALLLLISLLPCCAAAPETAQPEEPWVAPLFDETFWGHWGDGRAELAGYELTYTRYGEPRAGTAVTIFVTEPFSESRRVKHERPSAAVSDVFQVLKLNLIQDFATGIYDYNMMTSVFVALESRVGRSAGTSAKISFSSQEWCGQVYSQAWFDRDDVRLQSHSYFDGEPDADRALAYPRDGLAEDALLVWARGLAAPLLSPGESREVALLRSLERSRLVHVETAWDRATIARSADTRRVRVPAGEFEVETWTVDVAGSPARRSYPPGSDPTELPVRQWSFLVEKQAPRRLIRWSLDDLVRAELVASDRLAYWSMNGPGLERALERLGLQPRGPRTP